MSEPIKFRPHHFLCSLGFQGKGYSPEFTQNMYEIVVERLRAKGGDEEVIQTVGLSDDICGPCPKRRGRLCTEQSKIKSLDRAHAAALKLKPNEQLTWGEAKARIKANVPSGHLSEICKGCQWLEYGLCETALAELHAEA
ncbi:DUF1284 domain-containing protein [Halocynthiibacter sp. C4]|uniref:DUF1284 domain-containing protein n=1 Tax=Halocynthiibacter sp. C4 TaxID=2992758 RepID=UPI00237A1D98|nr:DUF1284 domain-containing protein [Halocynthiibacter sp. C4]MDE0589288.1 DUF1284 domain-containing protein [Halocynthiibacter sp. C4]